MSGELSPVFSQVLEAIRARSPRFVVNTGDMIYGRTNVASALRQWTDYTNAISRLRAPTHHVPGNHDIWGPESATLYREILGPSYFVADYGRARLIGLDTETHASRLGPEQFGWLKQQLAEAGSRRVFVVLHRPLFPVDGGIGTSLDANPAERDKLHQLFVEHRKSIEAVFQGHEHLYHCQVRDGVRYYTTGGGGANLYEFPELGGFHHFLMVRVSSEDIRIELVKVGAPPRRLEEAVRLRPGALLEDWENGLVWYTWDYTVSAETEPNRASRGRRGLRLNFDLAQCPWPVLSTAVTGWDAREMSALLMDVFVPPNLNGTFTLTPTLEGTRKTTLAPTVLRAGWNTVTANLAEAPRGEQDSATLRGVEWVVSATENRERGALYFDQLRARRLDDSAGLGSTQLLEDWERALLWKVVDESVAASRTDEVRTRGRSGMKVAFDFGATSRPMLLSRLNPPWDMTGLETIVVDVFVPDRMVGSVALSVGFRWMEMSHLSRAVALRSGWNQVAIDLAWLPREVRRAAEQIELRFSASTPATRGWVVVDNLRGGGP